MWGSDTDITVDTLLSLEGRLWAFYCTEICLCYCLAVMIDYSSLQHVRANDWACKWENVTASMIDFVFPEASAVKLGKGDRVTRLEPNKYPFMWNKSKRQHECGDSEKNILSVKSHKWIPSIFTQRKIYRKTLAMCSVRAQWICAVAFRDVSSGSQTHIDQRATTKLLDPLFIHIHLKKYISISEPTLLSERISFFKEVSIVNLLKSSYQQPSFCNPL